MRYPNISSIALIAAVCGIATLAPAVERGIDVEHSSIRIHVGKAGLFSAAGHEHWVNAPIASGIIDEDAPGRITFAIQSSTLTLEPDKSLKPEQQAEVQRTMQEKVLEVPQYPEISFQSRSVKKTGVDTWTVAGDLSLHGRTKSVSALVHKLKNAYEGSCQFKQTSFGIHPVSVGGFVKVKDELDIHFSILPAARQ